MNTPTHHADNTVPAWREVMADSLITLSPLDKHWSPELEKLTEVPVPVSELPTPSFTVDLTDMSHNLSAMHQWCSARGVDLAPHGKTTMTPALWQWQIASGCWAITVANVFQLRVARQFGVSRAVVANEMLSPEALHWVSGQLNATSADEFDVTCWADSVAAVNMMSEALIGHGLNRPLGVCVEIGAEGSRAGERQGSRARAIAEAIHRSPVLQLRGLSGYEGSVRAESDEELTTAVRDFLADMRQTFIALQDLYETDRPLLTAGGSAWFDQVVETFTGIAEEVKGSRTLLRSGAYIIHDHVRYAAVTPSATRSGPDLVPAASVYARVLSTPEPGRALLDAGRRDLPYDAGMPVPLDVRRWASSTAEPVPEGALLVTRMDDQHAYVDVSSDRPEVGDLEVGDVIRLGLSHPCTMFDKWRSVLLVEQGYAVGVVPTYF